MERASSTPACLGVTLCHRSSSLQGMAMGPLLLGAMLAMPHRMLQVSHWVVFHTYRVLLPRNCQQQAHLAGNMYMSL